MRPTSRGWHELLDCLADAVPLKRRERVAEIDVKERNGFVRSTEMLLDERSEVY